MQLGMQKPGRRQASRGISESGDERFRLGLLDHQFHRGRGVQVGHRHQRPRLSSSSCRVLTGETVRVMSASASLLVRAGLASPRAMSPSRGSPPTGTMRAARRPLLLTSTDSPASTLRRISPLRLRISRCVTVSTGRSVARCSTLDSERTGRSSPCRTCSSRSLQLLVEQGSQKFGDRLLRALGAQVAVETQDAPRCRVADRDDLGEVALRCLLVRLGGARCAAKARRHQSTW